MADMNLIGASVKRKEDYRFLTGAGTYTDDVRLDRQSYAYFLRSPHAHASIRSINTDKAKKPPGVLGLLPLAIPYRWQRYLCFHKPVLPYQPIPPMKEPPH